MGRGGDKSPLQAASFASNIEAVQSNNDFLSDPEVNECRMHTIESYLCTQELGLKVALG